MSDGELCKSRVWISLGGTNSIAGFWCGCTQWPDHDGKHSAQMMCVQNNPRGHHDNHRIGLVQWGDDIADKQPKAAAR